MNLGRRSAETYRGKYETRLPPITINRHLKVSLSEQVAEGLRHAIRAGFYRPGDILPPLGALMSCLGISLRVARDAIRRLASDNLVMTRPRVGCQILHPRAKCRQGRVLAVASVENMTSYYHAALLLEIGRHMTESGYFFETVPLFLTKSGRVDLAPLKDRLMGPVSIVMAYHPVPSVSRYLSALSVPYVAVGSVSNMKCTTYVRNDGSKSVKTFVDACVRHGVRRALVAEYGDNRVIGDELDRIGICTERISIPVKFGLRVGEELERDVMNAVIARVNGWHSRNIPDVFCASDDFVTRGALAAFSHLGVRIPGDMWFVGGANDGASPVLPCKMSCFLYDPIVAAGVVSDALLRHMKGKNVPHDIFYERKFVFGDTFPSPKIALHGDTGIR